MSRTPSQKLAKFLHKLAERHQGSVTSWTSPSTGISSDLIHTVHTRTRRAIVSTKVQLTNVRKYESTFEGTFVPSKVACLYFESTFVRTEVRKYESTKVRKYESTKGTKVRKYYCSCTLYTCTFEDILSATLRVVLVFNIILYVYVYCNQIYCIIPSYEGTVQHKKEKENKKIFSK